MDIFYSASSWDEFLHDLRERPIQPKWQGRESSISGDSYFTHSDSWEHALQLAEQGCPVTTRKVESASVKVNFQAGPTWDFAPVGVLPCIPAYAAGVPEDMMVPNDEGASNQKPIVRISVNIAASGSVSADSIINRGAAIVALIDKIQSEGQRVELIAVLHADQGRENFAASITVKRPEEPVDMDRVAFAFAHPSMLRRCLFRVMEFSCKRYVSGYGRPDHFPELLKDSDMNIRPIGTGDPAYRDRDSAIDKVQELWDRAAA